MCGTRSGRRRWKEASGGTQRSSVPRGRDTPPFCTFSCVTSAWRWLSARVDLDYLCESKHAKSNGLNDSEHEVEWMDSLRILKCSVKGRVRWHFMRSRRLAHISYFILIFGIAIKSSIPFLFIVVLVLTTAVSNGFIFRHDFFSSKWHWVVFCHYY